MTGPNTFIGALDMSGSIQGNRLVGTATLTSGPANNIAGGTGPADGSFFRDAAQDLGIVFVIPGGGQNGADAHGVIFGRD